PAPAGGGRSSSTDVMARLGALLRKRELERRPLDMNDAVREIVRLVRTDAGQRHVKLQLALARDLPTVDGDRVCLQQVLLNLIANGIEAMNERAWRERRLTVRTRRGADGAVEVTVVDRGRGIPLAVASRIFEPFFTTRADGTGLGLAIARSIVEAHGGTLEAHNWRAGGAAFRI